MKASRAVLHRRIFSASSGPRPCSKAHPARASRLSSDRAACVCGAPWAILRALPKKTARITRAKPFWAANPRLVWKKSPICTKLSSGHCGQSRWAQRSLRRPVLKTARSRPQALATDRPAAMVAVKASCDIGRTRPVVPSIEMPPTMPRRALSVLRAISTPCGANTSTAAEHFAPWTASAAATAWVIMRRGPGLMAGSPGGSSSPGLVIRPTPSPPQMTTSGGPVSGPARGLSLTRAPISAPWVTSGSSPASLMTVQTAAAPARRQLWTGTVMASPVGRATDTAAGGRPSSRRSTAPRAAAAAAVPVVKPVRRRFFIGSDLFPSGIRYRASRIDLFYATA